MVIATVVVNGEDVVHCGGDGVSLNVARLERPDGLGLQYVLQLYRVVAFAGLCGN